MRWFNPHTKAANDWFLRIIFALCVLALMLFAASAAFAQSAELPPLPDSVRTQMGYVSIFRAQLPCGAPRALGCFSMSQRAIVVRDSLPLVVAWRAYLHELGHLRLSDTYIRIGDAALEDSIVDMWARYEVEAMLARKPD